MLVKRREAPIETRETTMKHTILGVGCLLLMGLSWHVGAFDEDDLKKLKATNECLKCDLSRVNLKGAYLYAANLTRANLTGHGCLA